MLFCGNVINNCHNYGLLVDPGEILNHSMAINVVKARAHTFVSKRKGGRMGHVTRAHLCLKGLRVWIWHTYTHTHAHTRARFVFFSFSFFFTSCCTLLLKRLLESVFLSQHLMMHHLRVWISMLVLHLQVLFAVLSLTVPWHQLTLSRPVFNLSQSDTIR